MAKQEHKSQTPPSSTPPNYVRLEGSERKARPGTKRIRAADPDEKINVTLCIRRRPGGPPLPDHEHWIKNPPGKRQYLSREQFEEDHGSTQADLDAVADHMQARGMQIVEKHRAKRIVIISGTVKQMNEVFQVDLGHYQSDKETYRGREGHIFLPTAIAALVEGVFGLDNRRMAKRASGFSATSPLTPIQVAQFYNFPTGGATGETIGLFEFSDPVAGDAGYDPNDIKKYFTTSEGIGPGFVTPALQDVTIAGPGNSPGSEADTEVVLDICVAGAVAQGAKIAVYFTTWDENGWLLAIKAAVHPTGSQPSVSVVSISWDWAEFDSLGNLSWSASAMNQVSATFQDGASFGQTFFVASGDYGSDCGEGDGKAHVFYPASDPWITACGGTSIGTESGSYAEVTWNDNGVTGGGISDNFPLPAWQQGAGVPASINPGGRVGRGVPDIAGYANGYSVVQYGSSQGPFPGTSETAPLYAGLAAVLNAKLNASVGFLNPTLYYLALLPGGSGVFRDINDGGSNATDGAPGYTAGPGWDACTGLGVLDGGQLFSYLQTIFLKSLTFIMQRSTYGQDEVAAAIANNNGDFNQALFVVVDGLKPTDFPNGGITALSSGSNPPSMATLAKWAPVIPSPIVPDPPPGVSGTTDITITPTRVDSSDPSLSAEVQQFTFTYTVHFPDQKVFTNFPATDFPEVLTLNATLAAGSGMLSASGQIELIEAADPFFSSESNGGVYYLSEDLRVFYAEEGSTLFGAPALGNTPAAARSFIQWIIKHISGANGVGPNGDSFENTLSNSESSALSLLPTTFPGFGPTKNIYNFAIARVRLNGTSAAEEAKKVRGFFRLFQSQSVATVYQSPGGAAGVSPGSGPYRQWSDGTVDGQKIPLLGISADGAEYISVPCFAGQRVDSATNMTTQTDPHNVQEIIPVAGETVYTYFGCWLDNNQLDTAFPLAPGANPDGPFTGQALNTVSQLLDRGGHQCLMVEIVDDEAPIINNATPGTSDKIAQRNLAFTIVANPGIADSRTALHTFEIKPSTTSLGQGQWPDELMIDWGNVPGGSTASIYLPKVAAADVLAMAAEMYVHPTLSMSDAHTLQVATGGITYIPIPDGSIANYAGLLTVELPMGIKKGQEFKIVVRQVSSALVNKDRLVRQRRYISGAFQINIPVSVKAEMLVPEERTLSFMRWIQQSIPATNRWYPVFLRYVKLLAGRVDSLGGNSSLVPATPTGIWPGLGKPGPGGPSGPGGSGDHHHHHHHLEDHHPAFTGKIHAIIYDHFGDFEAFVLETFDGDRHRFDSREPAILKLVQRAWGLRILITVVVRHEHPEVPLEIKIHGAPPQIEYLSN